MDEKVRDVLELRRTAKETKRYRVVMRSLGLLVVLLIILVAIGYAISYFYDRFGAFTVKVNKYDMIRQGLTLSETPDYDISNARLSADIVNDMTNISGTDLPKNIDMVNGSHNGESYIAYTFYLINSGDDTLSYEGQLNLENVTKNVDEAIRVAVWVNGEKKVYGKTKSNGKGIESDCDETFDSSTIVMKTKHTGFKPKGKDKFTVVIWLEGNDPDCTDEIIGGTMKLGMDFKIIETT
ncbi:MAG: hypothetical protein K6D02_01320 [Lachnospiraceae bacterium]|nr:hypothetical protein [Lachnospiraceae bacterium]